MSKTNLGDLLSNSTYLRSRQQPEQGDPFYLHLSDILLVLREWASEDEIDILDFGSGGSPYQFLFPNSRYHRADIPGDVSLDYIISGQNTISAPDLSYDIVLSTQVLEHVKHPHLYLNECKRLLRPGGLLLLTTHGFFEEHGCPYDFHRWTAEGLKTAVRDAGLEAQEARKLTTQGRAAAFMLPYLLGTMARWRVSLLGWVFVAAHRLGLLLHPLLNKWSDRYFADCRVVNGETTGHPLYVGVFVAARKPVAESPAEMSFL